MKSDKRTECVTRDRVLELLSDDEVASVGNAEAVIRLEDGDEYVDLRKPEQGVRQAQGAVTPMARVLPRKSVHEHTWSKILEQLSTASMEWQLTGT